MMIMMVIDIIMCLHRHAWSPGWGDLANVILQSEKKIIMSYLHICWKCWNSNWLEIFWVHIYKNKCSHIKCNPRLFFLKHILPKTWKNNFQRHQILLLNWLTLQVNRYFVPMEFTVCCHWGNLLKQVHKGSLAHRCPETGLGLHQSIHWSMLLLLQLHVLLLDRHKDPKKSRI